MKSYILNHVGDSSAGQHGYQPQAGHMQPEAPARAQPSVQMHGNAHGEVLAQSMANGQMQLGAGEAGLDAMQGQQDWASPAKNKVG